MLSACTLHIIHMVVYMSHFREPFYWRLSNDICPLYVDILLTELEEFPELQNRISELLEMWWCGDRPDKDGIVPNCLLYVIARTLSEQAKVCTGLP